MGAFIRFEMKLINISERIVCKGIFGEAEEEVVTNLVLLFETFCKIPFSHSLLPKQNHSTDFGQQGLKWQTMQY